MSCVLLTCLLSSLSCSWTLPSVPLQSGSTKCFSSGEWNMSRSGIHHLQAWPPECTRRLSSLLQLEDTVGNSRETLEQGSPTSGIQCLMISAGSDIIIIEMKYTINKVCLNHPQTIHLTLGSLENWFIHKTSPRCPKVWGLLS